MGGGLGGSPPEAPVVIFLKTSFTVLVVPIVKNGLRFFVPGKNSFVPSSHILDPDFATFQLWLVLSNNSGTLTTRALGLTSTEISELRIAYVYETRAPTRYLQVPVYFKLFTENDLTALELSTYYELTLAKEKPECREIGIREFSHDVGRIWLCEDGVFQRRTVGVKAWRRT